MPAGIRAPVLSPLFPVFLLHYDGVGAFPFEADKACTWHCKALVWRFETKKPAHASRLIQVQVPPRSLALPLVRARRNDPLPRHHGAHLCSLAFFSSIRADDKMPFIPSLPSWQAYSYKGPGAFTKTTSPVHCLVNAVESSTVKR